VPFSRPARTSESRRRLVIDVVGDADWHLPIVAAFVVITPADKPNAALFSFAIAKMRFRIEAAPMQAKLEPGARFSRRDLSLGECLGHSVCCTVIRRISVEYMMVYVCEQYRILNIQPIEIIGC
jgi:hypothetical protein